MPGPGRPFAKGADARRGEGRPKAVKAVEDAAREHTADAIATLARIAKDSAAPEAAQVAAANALLNRGWGMPRQKHDVRHHLPAATADDAALLAIALGRGGDDAAPPDDPSEPGGVVH